MRNAAISPKTDGEDVASGRTIAAAILLLRL